MDPQLRAAVLWGLVGALTFGVLYQAYVLLGASFALPVLLGGVVVVGAVTTAVTYVVEGHTAKESL